MRAPLSTLIAGGAAVAIGAAALIKGLVPVEAPALSSSLAPITVSDAWIAAPVPPSDSAAGYFTAQNNTDADERLVSVATGAGRSNTLHVYVDGAMTESPDGVVIPAHGRLVLSVGQGHVMIEHLLGELKAGQTVNMVLTFEHYPSIAVTAKVYAPGSSPSTRGTK